MVGGTHFVPSALPGPFRPFARNGNDHYRHLLNWSTSVLRFDATDVHPSAPALNPFTYASGGFLRGNRYDIHKPRCLTLSASLTKSLQKTLPLVQTGCNLIASIWPGVHLLIPRRKHFDACCSLCSLIAFT